MRRGGITRYAVWIALGCIGGAGLADCTDYGGDVPTYDGGPEAAATSDISANSPAPWDVMVPTDTSGGGALSDADASGQGNNDGSSGDDGSGSNAVGNGGSTPPGTLAGGDGAGASDDTGFPGSVDATEDADASDAEVADADAGLGTVEVGVVDVLVPDEGAETGAPDAGEADTGGADADASLQEGGVDAGAPDSGTPDSAADSGGGHGCNPTDPQATTQTCVAAQNKAASQGLPTHCAECVQTNGCYDPSLQGGTCDSSMLTTTLTHLAGMIGNNGPTCATVLGPEPVTEKTVCIQTLSLIFSSKCAASMQLTPCVCGTTDPTQCLAGTVTPNGPVYDEYACDFNSASGQTINTDFIIQTFGAGMADSIAQCAGAFGCDCF